MIKLIPLNPRSGDNSLIDDINTANQEVEENYRQSKTKNWTGIGLFNATVGGLAEELLPFGGVRDFGVSNPLNFLSYPGAIDPSFIKHFNNVGMVSNLVAQKETEVYKKNGFANLVPTVVLTMDTNTQEQVKPVASQLRLSFKKEESENSTITNVNAMTGQPDGKILISYDIKEGDKTRTSSMVVPRKNLGNLNQYLPEDPDEGWFEKIRAAGGTSKDIKYAPVVATPEGPLHYRIYPKNGGMQLQFFNPETRQLDYTDSPIPVFASLYDMNLFLSNLATNYANAKKTQTSK